MRKILILGAGLLGGMLAFLGSAMADDGYQVLDRHHQVVIAHTFSHLDSPVLLAQSATVCSEAVVDVQHGWRHVDTHAPVSAALVASNAGYVFHSVADQAQAPDERTTFSA
jgi:hypothetical protein